MFKEHTFSICAYGESKYLEMCVKSILNQTMKSKVIICTSTPNAYIKNIAEKYNIELHVNSGISNIKDDWNFAYNTADTKYVTLAHQDDCYNSRYTYELYKKLKKYNKKMLIYYCGYRPIKDSKITTDINCIIRAVLRIPMKIKLFSDNRFVKRLTLSLGNSICCPTVTYDKENLKESVFTSDLKFNIDWDTFYKLANSKGGFLYNSKILAYYRIHDGATSKAFIDNSERIREDIEMFDKFWPHFFTMFLMRFYKKAYETYTK